LEALSRHYGFGYGYIGGTVISKLKAIWPESSSPSAVRGHDFIHASTSQLNRRFPGDTFLFLICPSSVFPSFVTSLTIDGQLANHFGSRISFTALKIDGTPQAHPTILNQGPTYSKSSQYTT
jgi:hypothetical protein